MPDAQLPPPPALLGSDPPVHAQITVWLEQLITSGLLRPGDRLPTEVQIAALLGVSRMTLRQSLTTLAAKGLVETRRGRRGGNFITVPPLQVSLTGLPGLTEQMRRARVSAGADVVRAQTRAGTPDERSALRLPSRGRVHEVIRVRFADKVPVTLEETSLPAATFIGMFSFDLTGSLYQLMDREFGLSPFEAEEVIEPVIATAPQAELLQIEPGQPLLMVTRTSYAVDGRPVEFARDYFCPERTRIVLRTRVGQEAATSVEAR